MGYYLGLWWPYLDFKLDSEGADRRQKLRAKKNNNNKKKK